MLQIQSSSQLVCGKFGLDRKRDNRVAFSPRIVRDHRLRHYAATVMRERGERVEVISERLGHSSVTVTLNVYSWSLNDAKQKAAETHGAAFDEALAWQPGLLRKIK